MFHPSYSLWKSIFLKKTLLFAIIIQDLCQSCWSRKCSLDIISGSKLASAQLPKSSFKIVSELVIVDKVSLTLRLLENKNFDSHVFLRSTSKNTFHFPLLLWSRYFFIHVILRDSLKELQPVISRLSAPRSLIITFRFILPPLPFDKKV